MGDREAESKACVFYGGKGWDSDEAGTTLDAKLWEDLRSCATEYVSACRRRVLAHLPKSGNRLLDAGSGPIQYPEYLEYSSGFTKRVCVDISQKALDGAAEKLGNRGEYVRASILELPFPDNHFDAVVSLHTIYHIDRHQQEAAVRQLVRVVKPGATVVVVYANPHKLSAILRSPIVLLTRLLNGKGGSTGGGLLYFYCHPLSWWRRFSDECDVTILPWRSLTARESRVLVPDNRLGEFLLRGLLAVETSLPHIVSLLGAYPMIVLRKAGRG